MASMAVMGAMRASPSPASNLRKDKPHYGLAFSSSDLVGDKIRSSTAFLSRRRSQIPARTPIVVSPKAVSDSKNSQTCLDPEASRVSLSLSLSVCLSNLIQLN